MSAVLSIGTTHPWNIAGVGLDVRIATELRTRVLTIVTAVSAQDAGGVRALMPVSREVIDAQLDAMPWNQIAAVRIGALGSAQAVRAVFAALERRGEMPVVIDPVMGATRGGALADDETIDVLARTLLVLPAAIVTPNIPEAERLLQRAIEPSAVEAAAQELQQRGARAVLLKGGHHAGAPVDVLATAEATHVFTAPRIEREMRGTGCALAMALAISLASGANVVEAVTFARTFVRTKIASAVEFGGIPAYSSADD